jgi:hypothetical protein
MRKTEARVNGGDGGEVSRETTESTETGAIGCESVAATGLASRFAPALAIRGAWSSARSASSLQGRAVFDLSWW